MQPVVADLKRKCSKNVDFVAVNVDDPANRDISQKYGASSIPRYFLLDSSGNIVFRWLGAMPASEFAPMQRYCAVE